MSKDEGRRRPNGQSPPPLSDERKRELHIKAQQIYEHGDGELLCRLVDLLYLYAMEQKR